MPPSNEQSAMTRSVTDKQKNIQTPYFRTYSGMRCTIFPKLCTVIELVETIKEDVIHF